MAEKRTDMRDWKPFQHIERAQVLIGGLDARWDHDGEYTGSGGYITTPPVLTLAQVHLQIAEMKMLGKGRA